MPVDLKRSMTSHNTWVNDSIKRAKKFIDDNPDGLSTPGDRKVAERLIGKIEENITNMKTKWTTVFEPELEKDDPNDLFDEWDQKVHDADQKAENQIDELRAAIKTFETKSATTATNSSSPSDSKQPKMDNSFKPPILVASSTLEEFYSWEEQFLGHYKLNEAFLIQTNQDTRRIFVTCLLDSKIQAALKTDTSITLDTPIGSTNQENSLLKWLKDHLLRDSPLFIRRYEYSNCRQRPKESFGDWWTRKLMKAKECELNTVDMESVQITELICGIVDQRLREDILRLKDPTLDQLVAMGKRYDTSAKIQKDNFKEEVQVNKVSEYRRAKNQKNNPVNVNNDPESSNKSTNCKYCGYPKCRFKGPKDICKAKDMQCHKCGQTGHISPACQSEEVVKSKTAKVRVMGVKVEKKKSFPELPEKLSLDKGLESFLEWKDHLGHNWKQFLLEDLLEPQLLELVEERTGESVELSEDLDFECLVNELQDIFDEEATNDSLYDEDDQIDDEIFVKPDLETLPDGGRKGESGGVITNLANTRVVIADPGFGFSGFYPGGTETTGSPLVGITAQKPTKSSPNIEIRRSKRLERKVNS